MRYRFSNYLFELFAIADVGLKGQPLSSCGLNTLNGFFDLSRSVCRSNDYIRPVCCKAKGNRLTDSLASPRDDNSSFSSHVLSAISAYAALTLRSTMSI